MPAPTSYSRRSFLITGRVAASALLNCTSCSTQSGHELMSDVARPSMSAMARNSRRSCSNNRVHYYYKLDVYIRISNTEFYANTQCVNQKINLLFCLKTEMEILQLFLPQVVSSPKSIPTVEVVSTPSKLNPGIVSFLFITPVCMLQLHHSILILFLGELSCAVIH